MRMIFYILLVLASKSLFAGSGGAMTGGSTEVTQLLNNAQLVQQYAQMVMSYENQLQQYATMIKNLASNPNSLTLSNLQQIANNGGRLMQYGQNIGSSLAKIDQQIAQKFDSPAAQSYSDKFKGWTQTSQDGFKATLRNAGLQREQFSDDTAALQALTDNMASSQGNLSALQALGKINAAQVQESMKLRDLISQQQIATNNYMMAQSKKGEREDNERASLKDVVVDPIPSIKSSR